MVLARCWCIPLGICLWFYLDPSVGEFVLPQNYAKITMPESASIYSINEVSTPVASSSSSLIDYLKTRSEQPCGARYVGS